MSASHTPVPAFDWSHHDRYRISRVQCRCGTQHGSHVRTVFPESTVKPFVESRLPCPNCGKSDNVRASYGDWDQAQAQAA